MDLGKMVSTLKKHPESNKMGMIVSHLGIVRGTSRNGSTVTEIDVLYDHEKLNEIINDIKNMTGIVDVIVDVSEGTLKIGDDILAVVIGGDIRENVFPALTTVVNRIKAEAVEKKEMLI
jgi:molybdopterin synthase catalytic subunit